MAATVKAYCATGAGPTLATADSADSASVKYGRDDSQSSTATIPIPTAAGTHYSYLKYLLFDVTVAGATSLTNRRIAWASAPTVPGQEVYPLIVMEPLQKGVNLRLMPTAPAASSGQVEHENTHISHLKNAHE